MTLVARHKVHETRVCAFYTLNADTGREALMGQLARVPRSLRCVCCMDTQIDFICSAPCLNFFQDRYYDLLDGGSIDAGAIRPPFNDARDLQDFYTSRSCVKKTLRCFEGM